MAATVTREQLCVDVIRGLAMDAPQAANSGHPGTAMALAPVGWTLYGRVMRHNPANPRWVNRDRFVLSCGHACILQYSLLHICGYGLDLKDLRQFRQWRSLTPGHPESWVTPGVETTTGPLGQGLSNAVGFALAERFLASYFNRPDYPIVDHYTYVICSDGDLMEGVSSESCSLAGFHQLGKLICLYDDNKITIEGDTCQNFSEDVDARFVAYGWHVQRLASPNDLDVVEAALARAKLDPRPSLISIRTHIAYPAPDAVDTRQAHGAPLGKEEVEKTKAILGLPPAETFYVPPPVYEEGDRVQAQGAACEQAWNDLFARYAQVQPDLAEQFQDWMTGELPAQWDADLCEFSAGKDLATRESSSKVIQMLCKRIPNWLGGSADLAPSTLTWMEDCGTACAQTPLGRNFHWGIREHGMSAITSGLVLHGGLHAFCSTFFIFSDYHRPTIRLAAMMKLPVVYVWTHDSIGLGEDGPTHQAVEQLASLRAIPHFTLFRPADANEVLESWRYAVQHQGPVGLVLSRQPVPTFDRAAMAPASEVKHGGYVLQEASDKPVIILIASGSEVHVCLKARELLEAQGHPTRVVSLPCWEIFYSQSKDYRDKVLPPEVTARLGVEAGSSFGWERWIGAKGDTVCVEGYGASAPWQVNMEKYGFTPENIAAKAKRLIA